MFARVALLTESVDRNDLHQLGRIGETASLSSRRAWIEITAEFAFSERNPKSLSSRRAWIEIESESVHGRSCQEVALLTESVDRNRSAKCMCTNLASRSPHGERG